MAPPIIVGEKAQPASGGPAKQAAAQRVQRFWNPRTAHMEAMGAHGHLVGNEQFHRPAPPGHQVTHTQAKVTREVTPGAKPAVSFINMSPSEIEARARAITQAEIKGARGPFKEQLGLLGQEQTGALQTNTQAYGKLNETIGQQQASQAAGAKTFENYAADAVTKASQAAPGAQQTAERLGLKPGQQLPESARNQQEAARTLLSGIAQGSQAGTTARQQSEEQFLANLKATAAQGGVESGRAIEGQFGKQKADILGKEAAAVTRLQSMGPSLAQKLFSEQSAQRIAAGNLGVKQQQLGINAFKAGSTANYQQGKLKGEQAKIGQGNVKLAQGWAKIGREESEAPSKKRQREADTKYKEAKIKEVLAKAAVAGGKPLTTSQQNALSSEAAYIFNAMQSGVTRQELEKGSVEKYSYKAKNSKGQPVTKYGVTHGKAAKNPILITIAEQSIKQGYLSAELKAELRSKGINDTGWSNALFQQAGKNRPYQGGTHGVEGGVKAGVGKRAGGHRGK